jgi:hypothetical protein
MLCDETYGSDYVSLLNSPPLRPIKPDLNPFPDGIENGILASDDCAIDEVGFSLQWRGINRCSDHRQKASQNDAILINLLSGGRAVYVAHTAAMELLPSDHKISVDESHLDVIYKESYSGSTLSSISAQLSDVTQLMKATPANVTISYINSKNRPSFSMSPPDPPLFQATQATQSADHTPQLFSTIKNLQQELPSSNRPHYCPVKGCYRGEGGKGFKTKNEMIRHGLQHESLGYVCPYCVYRQHKYPRPDNLQR